MARYEPARVGEGRREQIDPSVIVPILNEASTKASGEALAKDDDGLLRVPRTTISVVNYEGEWIVPSAEPRISR